MGQIAIALGTLVGVRLLTEVLRPAAYGELALAMTLAALMNQVLLGPLAGAAMRFFAPSQETGQLLEFLDGTKHLLSQVTLLIVLLVLAFLASLKFSGRGEWVVLAGLASVFALVSGYGSVLDGIQNAARQRIIVAWHNSLATWLRFLLAVALVSALGASSSVAMLGFVIASIVVLSSQFLFFRSRILPLAGQNVFSGLPKDPDSWRRQMRHYAWPFATWGVFTWLQLASDRWALQLFGNTRDVGLYSVLLQLGYYPATLMAGMLMQLIAPIMFARAGDGSDFTRLKTVSDLNRKLIWVTLALTVLASVVAALTHQYVFSILASPEYSVVSGLLPIVLLSGGLFAAGQLASMPLLMGMQTNRMIAPKIGTAILGVVSNVIGAWLWGVNGVVLAGLVFATVYFFWMYSLAGNKRPTA